MKPQANKAKKPTALILLVAFSTMLALTGCASWLPQTGLPWQQNAPSTTETALPQQTETQPLLLETQTEPFQSEAPKELVLWLPAEMDPGADNQAASLLASRLATFAETEDITITIRIKNLSGAGGLLDALTATSSAAPQAMPDLILLARRDLETAALKSLVMPLDPLTSIVDEEDWFPYAHEMSLIQGVVYGIPFIGDPLSLITKAGADTALQAGWQSIAEPGSVFSFPADDAQALLPLTLYMELGGAFSGNQLRPALDAEILLKALILLEEGQQNGSILKESAQWQNFQQSWESFLNGSASRTAAPLSLFLAQYAKTEATPEELPVLLETGFTLSSGWLWALSSQDSESQALSLRLAEYLVENGFLGAWSEAFGRVPARPSALENWQKQTLRMPLMQQSLGAKFLPVNEVMASVSPALRGAVLAVLRDNDTPEEAAKQAVEGFK